MLSLRRFDIATTSESERFDMGSEKDISVALLMRAVAKRFCTRPTNRVSTARCEYFALLAISSFLISEMLMSEKKSMCKDSAFWCSISFSCRIRDTCDDNWSDAGPETP